MAYTEKEYELEGNILKLNAVVIQNKISKFIDFNQDSQNESPYRTFLRKEPEIRALHNELNQLYSTRTSLNIYDTSGSLHNLIDIRIQEDEFKSIQRNFMTKQRAFYSEVIFFTILVISGVIWVFGKLESLLNLNKMQNNFLLSITHELKTPLTAIKLSSQTLQHRKTDEETRLALIQQIVNNSDRLNELLDNVLLATRIDGKSYKYNMSRINLTQLIQKTGEQILSEPYFTGRFIFDEEDKEIFCDDVSMRLVFSNLFQNAVKYAGKDCDVVVRYADMDGKFTILISDNGNGMDTSEHKSIFNKFYRVGDENTRENKGTGLGLFLVRQILKSHNATIKAESNTPKGTIFNITFKTL